MKKVIFTSAAVIAVLAITLGLYAQPAGGGGGGFGGGGFGGGGFGGGGGGGMMGGGMMGGGRGMRGPVQRPDKAARLADIKTLETQVAALRAAIEKAPEKDPNIANLTGDALTKFMDVYTPEQDAVNNIQTTLATMSGRSAGGGGRGGRGGGALTTDTLSELRTLANDEKATKVVARIDELIKEAQTAATRRGNRGGGGGMMGGGGRGGRGGAGGGAGGGMMGGGA